MVNPQKEAQVKLIKGLTDLVILQFLSVEPMHVCQVIARMRPTFGVYFEPSTIHPLLTALEKKNYVHSEWTMTSERPRKIYKLTVKGQNTLNHTENTLNLMLQKISTNGAIIDTAVESAKSTAFNPMLKKLGYTGRSFKTRGILIGQPCKRFSFGHR